MSPHLSIHVENCRTIAGKGLDSGKGADSFRSAIDADVGSVDVGGNAGTVGNGPSLPGTSW
eukprot:8860871-Karenia_brevis.AAC.1